jgi:alkanesulfonate monooxygenase SsuD/methylene tetrahydromethanopterin reductase-like flavin-dependent oxidoreductase (luciferase family)
MCGPGGAFLVGDPETVARKLAEASDDLGGVSRFTFQMSPASTEHQAMLKAIELLGKQVAPVVRKGAINRS